MAPVKTPALRPGRGTVGTPLLKEGECPAQNVPLPSEYVPTGQTGTCSRLVPLSPASRFNRSYTPVSYSVERQIIPLSTPLTGLEETTLNNQSETEAVKSAMLELAEARDALRAAYEAKPRRTPMMDRYIRVANSLTYAMMCACEAIKYGDPAAPTRRRIARGMAQAAKLRAALDADPYVCRSADKLRAWQASRREKTA